MLIVYRRALQFFVAGAGIPLGVRSAAQLLEVRRIVPRALERDWTAVGEDMLMALNAYGKIARQERLTTKGD
ncbi:MAG: hypothetical protein ABW189_07540 [Rickettsiales bacterium]